MNNLHEKNIELTKISLKNSITRDIIIIQVMHTIDELIKIENKLTANLRERAGYYSPRASRIEDTEIFLQKILKHDDFGIEPTKDELNSIKEVIKTLKEIKSLRKSHEAYIEKLMEETCPNLLRIVGSLTGARLLSLSGSLKNLAEMPSSKIQVLGAEKALFRHLKERTKAPKFGIIFAHESIQKAKNKGQASRRLAAAISKATRIDYFRNK